MPILQQGKIILGFNLDGQKFRPSDWITRIASIYGCFDTSHHLRYDPNVLPVHFEEQNGLFIADRLAVDNPVAWQHIMNFVSSNRLQIRYHLKPEETPEPPIDFSHAA